MPTFSTKSWHARLHRHFFRKHIAVYDEQLSRIVIKEHELPNNLCPYFWSIIIGCIFYPIHIVVYPMAWLFNKIIGSPARDTGIYHDDNIGVSIAAVFAFCLLFVYSGIFWNSIDTDFFIGSAMLWIMTIFSIIVVLVKEKIHSYKEKKATKNQKDGFISSVIKAKRDKICPIITWENSDHESKV